MSEGMRFGSCSPGPAGPALAVAVLIPDGLAVGSEHTARYESGDGPAPAGGAVQAVAASRPKAIAAAYPSLRPALMCGPIVTLPGSLLPVERVVGVEPLFGWAVPDSGHPVRIVTSADDRGDLVGGVATRGYSRAVGGWQLPDSERRAADKCRDGSARSTAAS